MNKNHWQLILQNYWSWLGTPSPLWWNYKNKSCFINCASGRNTSLEKRKKNKATKILHSNFWNILSSHTRLKALSALKILAFWCEDPFCKYSKNVGHFLNKFSFFNVHWRERGKCRWFNILMIIYTNDWKIVFTSILLFFVAVPEGGIPLLPFVPFPL